MINIKIKGPNVHDTPCSQGQVQFSVIKPRLWIGRGEEVLEKEGINSHVLNLAAYSKAVSRIHATLLFSPAFFHGNWSHPPSFLFKLCQGWGQVGSGAVNLIWQFLRPRKCVLLKDNQSKSGLFRKLERESLSTGMSIVLGDSRPIIVHNREIYDSHYSLSMRLEQLQAQSFSILNPTHNITLVTSFWVICYRSNNYILLNCPSQRILIGRSSECHLVITQPAMSRKHASLCFQEGEWFLSDGDGMQASSNGLWVKSRKMWIGFDGGDGMVKGETKCKVGDILVVFNIKDEQNAVQIEECVSFNKSTDNSLQQSLRKVEFEDGPGLEKHGSQL